MILKSNLSPRLEGLLLLLLLLGEKKSHRGREMNNFFLFYSPKPQSQVRILILKMAYYLFNMTKIWGNKGGRTEQQLKVQTCQYDTLHVTKSGVDRKSVV